MKDQNIDELTSEFISYLESLKRSKDTIYTYCCSWKKLKAYMLTSNIAFFNKSVGEKYLEFLYGKFNYNELSPGKRLNVNQIEALAEFQDKGRVVVSSRRAPKVFDGSIGHCMLEYVAHRKSAFGSAERTLIGYYHHLYLLHDFLRTNRIDHIQMITQSVINAFIANIDQDKLATKKVACGILKGFFAYLHSNQQLPHALSITMPRINYQKESHLPSTFTKEEIGTLLEAVDRASPNGKRNYAILLLAIKLGMRAADIRELKFENILWDRNLIKFNQRKTDKEQMLPLLPEIGNAIIDYLKYGRPDTGECYVFLQSISPYKPLHYGSVGEMTQRHLARAGIDLHGRKHGSHALRHSFANRLLDEKTPLPIISEAMGHSRTQSTMTYLRIDINTMAQCALEVPVLPFSFYPKRGGWL